MVVATPAQGSNFLQVQARLFATPNDLEARLRCLRKRTCRPRRMSSVRLVKWKCKVCRFIMESIEPPAKCGMCKAEAHKIKEVRYGRRLKSGTEVAESD